MTIALPLALYLIVLALLVFLAPIVSLKPLPILVHVLTLPFWLGMFLLGLFLHPLLKRQGSKLPNELFLAGCFWSGINLDAQ